MLDSLFPSLGWLRIVELAPIIPFFFTFDYGFLSSSPVSSSFLETHRPLVPSSVCPHLDWQTRQDLVHAISDVGIGSVLSSICLLLSPLHRLDSKWSNCTVPKRLEILPNYPLMSGA